MYLLQLVSIIKVVMKLLRLQNTLPGWSALPLAFSDVSACIALHCQTQPYLDQY